MGFDKENEIKSIIARQLNENENNQGVDYITFVTFTGLIYVITHYNKRLSAQLNSKWRSTIIADLVQTFGTTSSK